jgi:hypothetical protein
MTNPKVGTPVLIVRRETHSVQHEAGLIAFVHNDKMVNVAGFNANGAPFNMTSLTLVQDSVAPDLGDYAYFASAAAPVKAVPPPLKVVPPVVAHAAPVMSAVPPAKQVPPGVHRVT